MANLLSAIARDDGPGVMLALNRLVDMSDHEPISGEVQREARWLWQLLYVSLLPVDPHKMS